MKLSTKGLPALSPSAAIAALSTVLLASSLQLSSVSAALPPGYEDNIHCPPSTTCQIYTNPLGIVGPSSTFYKCYDESTGEITNGIWTGSLTNVTAPEDYIENPPMCTSEQYSECNVDEDCELHIQSNGPSVDSVCNCYVESSLKPFLSDPFCADDTTGEQVPCEDLKCDGNECDAYVAVCVAGGGEGQGGGGGGTCSIVLSSDADTVMDGEEEEGEEAVELECTVDEDCYPTIRSRIPTSVDFTGVDMCECYAASDLVEFDECEGQDDGNCSTAKCAEDSCEGMEAVCMVEEGKCTLISSSSISSTSATNIAETSTEPATTESAMTTEEPPATTTEEPGTTEPPIPPVECTVDDECRTASRTQSPTNANITQGVEVCQCYASSELVRFDECEGFGGKDCENVKCEVDECVGLEAYCNVEEGVCALRDAPTSSTTTTATTTAVATTTLAGAITSEAADTTEAVTTTEAMITTEEPATTASATEGTTTEAVPLVECTVDDECSTASRTQSPKNANITLGVEVCQCYASSELVPFDECEGFGGKDCENVKCEVDECVGLEAYCNVDEGVCALRDAPSTTTTTSATATSAASTIMATSTVESIGSTSTKASPSSTETATTEAASSTTLPVECTVDEDCNSAIRSEMPSFMNATETPDAVDMCECYASSSLIPYDECEGAKGKECTKGNCDEAAIAACEEMEAYCVVEEGVCALRAGNVTIDEEELEASKVPTTSSVPTPAVSGDDTTSFPTNLNGTASPTPADVSTTSVPTPAEDDSNATAVPTPAETELETDVEASSTVPTPSIDGPDEEDDTTYAPSATPSVGEQDGDASAAVTEPTTGISASSMASWSKFISVFVGVGFAFAAGLIM